MKSLIKECIGQFLPDDFLLDKCGGTDTLKDRLARSSYSFWAQWSFIIYESVECSKTVFMNPSRKVIMNQWAMYGNVIPMDFIPKIPLDIL